MVATRSFLEQPRLARRLTARLFARLGGGSGVSHHVVALGVCDPVRHRGARADVHARVARTAKVIRSLARLGIAAGEVLADAAVAARLAIDAPRRAARRSHQLDGRGRGVVAAV